MKKLSIRTKLVAIMICSIVLTMGCFWIVNVTLLPTYYQKQKMSLLKDSYETTDGVYESSNPTEEEQERAAEVLDKSGGKRELNLFVFNLFHIYPDNYIPEYLYPQELSFRQIVQMEQRVNQYLNGEQGEDQDEEQGRDQDGEREQLYQNDQYGIYKSYDKKTDSYFMELFGTLSCGSNIYLRTSYQSMDDSVKIFNRFIVYIGLGIVLVFVILMYFISRSFTRPILNLSVIAKKMTELDFNERYQGNSGDEIGELGNSINILSDKLETTISELQETNRELTHEIENKIQIDEMRKEFLSNVSHELKTPIALIQGYAEGLIDNVNEDAESRAFYCEVIVDEANKMNQMVKKLLSLNQLEFGNMPLEKEDFDLTELTSSVLLNTQILTEQSEIQIVFDENEHIFVNAEEYWIEQVVSNYISNAIHYVSGEKRIEIRIYRKMRPQQQVISMDSATRQEASDLQTLSQMPVEQTASVKEQIAPVKVQTSREVVRMEVFNTGAPIPEEEMEKIWIKFYKVDKARTREYGGNGIGLSIVKAIMKMHQHQCGVENREDGVMFWFELDAV